MAGSQTDIDDIAAIRAVAERWARAVEESDRTELGRLVADDIVVVHGDGRLLSGRDAVLGDLTSSFEKFRVRQQIQSEETVVAGMWAFDRARVETTLMTLESGASRRFSSHTWTILRKDEAGRWCVARVIGVIERSSQGA